MEQEEKKRLEIYAPKTSKLQFISPDMLNKVTNGVTAASKKKTTSSASSVIVGSAQKQPPDFGASEMPQDVANPDAASKKTTSIRFMDEEYPDLGTKGKFNHCVVIQQGITFFVSIVDFIIDHFQSPQNAKKLSFVVLPEISNLANSSPTLKVAPNGRLMKRASRPMQTGPSRPMAPWM